MGEKRLKYLDMLQSVISRMASNQFTIRTWSIGLGTAVMGYVAAKDQHPTAAMLALLPASVFWLLDGYYLALERKFRALFETASQQQDDTPNFSFAAAVSSADWKAACRRPAVYLVHLPVIVLAVGIGVVTLLIQHFGWN
jgi:hypothetical protein